MEGTRKSTRFEPQIQITEDSVVAESDNQSNKRNLSIIPHSSIRRSENRKATLEPLASPYAEVGTNRSDHQVPGTQSTIHDDMNRNATSKIALSSTQLSLNEIVGGNDRGANTRNKIDIIQTDNLYEYKRQGGMVFFKKRPQGHKPTMIKNSEGDKSGLVGQQPQHLRNQYDYKKEHLLYIPLNFQTLNTDRTKKAFLSFNELSRTMPTSHEHALEELISKSGIQYGPSLPRSHTNTNALPEAVEYVNEQLQFNRLQREQLKKEMKSEKKRLMLPIIKESQTKLSLQKKMPYVKVMPSRRLYYGQGTESLQMFQQKSESVDGKQKLNDDTQQNAMNDQYIDTDPHVYNYKFFWMYSEDQYHDWQPPVREGQTFTPCGKQIILYGGISNDLLDEIAIYTPTTRKWERCFPKGDLPNTGRHGHSGCEYRKQLIIFGGEQKFNTTLNFRECLNDTRVFDLEKKSWKLLRCLGTTIDPRRNHSAGINDKIMYIYGGIQNEGHFLKDVWTLNLRNATWDEIQTTGDKENGIAFHSMTACFSSQSTFKDKDKKLQINGFYVFGGIDSQGKILNTLKVLQPDKKPAQWVYPQCKGVIPTARYEHSTSYYDPLSILIIYGGRNDQLYESSNTILLNDIRILNLETLSWAGVTNHGTVPKFGRYKHSTCIMGTQLMIFGGVSFNQYCDPDVLSIELSQTAVKKLIKDQQVSKEEKLANFRKMIDTQPSKILQDKEDYEFKAKVSFQPVPLTNNYNDVLNSSPQKVQLNKSTMKNINTFSFFKKMATNMLEKANKATNSPASRFKRGGSKSTSKVWD